MKCSHVLLGSTLLFAVVPLAHADGVADCFPMCPEPVAAEPGKSPDLCAHAVVRDVARIDRDLAPIKRVIGAVTNPTGFALEQVDKHVVHIPRWVGYAIDPRGALRAAVMKRVRNEAKKAVGLENGCAVDASDAPGEPEREPREDA